LKLPLLILLAVFTLAALPLSAQEEREEQEEQELAPEIILEAEQTADDRLFVITEFKFNITGRTRPSALIHTGEFKLGETLTGQANLDKYAIDKAQILVNQRILKDNAEVTYAIGEQAEDGSYPVILTIKVEDSWNIIALPRPYYKSDKGFELTIRARDYNFLGTMNPLRVNFGYSYDTEKRSSFLLEILSDLPFDAFGYHWNVRFDNFINYRPQVEEPYFYQNVTGLSMELPYRKTMFTFDIEEATILNEENADVYKLSKGLGGTYPDFQSGLYMSTRPSVSWKIPTGLFVSRFGELTYTPGLSATFNHELPAWELQEFRRGPSMGFNHSLYFEKIDWHSNYREGISASFNNAYDYNFYSLYHDKAPLSASLSLNGIGHFIISNFFGISSRLMYRHWFIYNDPVYYDSASNAMRGMPDKKITADYMLSLNTDFPLRVLMFTPSEWLHNRKFRFFDFELHLSPVIDLALYHDPRTETSFHPQNIAASGGIEAIFFPAFMRNFIVRLGYALVPNREDFEYELYLIMGHFY